jgi:hypothetical protein
MIVFLTTDCDHRLLGAASTIHLELALPYFTAMDDRST